MVMKKGQKKRVWTKEQKLEIINKHLKEHVLIFTILILPIHEHGIFLHLLVSSLISFTSVL